MSVLLIIAYVVTGLVVWSFASVICGILIGLCIKLDEDFAEKQRKEYI